MPRFKPLSEIVRNARGRKIGRLCRRGPHKFEAWEIGRFRTKREALDAIRARHEARR
jgi:hypothetical protein